MNFSQHKGPEDTVRLDLVRVRLWFHPEESDVVYYKLPAKMVNQLAEFVETGKLASELRAGLQAALQDFPAWSELSIDDDLTKEQRESVAGRFVLLNGRKVIIECNLDLEVAFY